MVTVVVRIPQASVGLVHAARVVAQLGARVRVALAGLHTLPAARLVLVIGVVLLVLDTQPLRLLPKGRFSLSLSRLRDRGQGWDEQAAGTTSVSLGGPGELCACPHLCGGGGPRPCAPAPRLGGSKPGEIGGMSQERLRSSRFHLLPLTSPPEPVCSLPLGLSKAGGCRGQDPAEHTLGQREASWEPSRDSGQFGFPGLQKHWHDPVVLTESVNTHWPLIPFQSSPLTACGPGSGGTALTGQGQEHRRHKHKV